MGSTRMTEVLVGSCSSCPTARRLAALGLCEAPTNVAPLVLVLTDLGKRVAAFGRAQEGK